MCGGGASAVLVVGAITGLGSLDWGVAGLGLELRESDSGSNRLDSGIGRAEAEGAITPSCEGGSSSDSCVVCKSGGRTTPPRTRWPLRSQNVIEGFIEHGISGIHFYCSVMAINAEDVAITLAAHSETGPVLTAITELVRVASGRSNEYLGRTPE